MENFGHSSVERTIDVNRIRQSSISSNDSFVECLPTVVDGIQKERISRYVSSSNDEEFESCEDSDEEIKKISAEKFPADLNVNINKETVKNVSATVAPVIYSNSTMKNEQNHTKIIEDGSEKCIKPMDYTLQIDTAKTEKVYSINTFEENQEIVTDLNVSIKNIKNCNTQMMEKLTKLENHISPISNEEKKSEINFENDKDAIEGVLEQEEIKSDNSSNSKVKNECNPSNKIENSSADEINIPKGQIIQITNESKAEINIPQNQNNSDIFKEFKFSGSLIDIEQLEENNITKSSSNSEVVHSTTTSSILKADSNVNITDRFHESTLSTDEPKNDSVNLEFRSKDETDIESLNSIVNNEKIKSDISEKEVITNAADKRLESLNPLKKDETTSEQLVSVGDNKVSTIKNANIYFNYINAWFIK